MAISFFCWIRDPGMKKIRIRDKHLGSITLGGCQFKHCWLIREASRRVVADY
jgi:hypothetical protein